MCTDRDLTQIHADLRRKHTEQRVLIALATFLALAYACFVVVNLVVFPSPTGVLAAGVNTIVLLVGQRRIWQRQAVLAFAIAELDLESDLAAVRR